MYKVKNKKKDVRKFRDRKLGKDIYVNAKKHVLTNFPPEENEVWSVTIEQEKKPVIKKVEKPALKKEDEFNIEKEEKEDQLNDKEVKTWQQ